MRKRRKRPYVLRERARRLAETRTRIVEAIMHLHEEVGPRHTSVAAVAKRAGVERLTVYRHFPDEAAMIAACSQHFLALHPPPDPAAWTAEPAPLDRARRGLGAIHGYFRRTAAMFRQIYRDADDHPAVKEALAHFDAYLRGVADELAAAWPAGRERTRRTRILRHAVRFSTWQSLEADGLNDVEKVACLLDWVAAPARQE